MHCIMRDMLFALRKGTVQLAQLCRLINTIFFRCLDSWYNLYCFLPSAAEKICVLPGPKTYNTGFLYTTKVVLRPSRTHKLSKSSSKTYLNPFKIPQSRPGNTSRISSNFVSLNISDLSSPLSFNSIVSVS